MLPYAWRLSLSVARTALGIGSLALYLICSPISWGVLPFIVYVGYSLFALRRSLSTDGEPHLTLPVDTISFVAWLVFTPGSGGSGLWVSLGLIIYLFLISSAVLHSHWTRVLAVVLLCLIAAFILPADTVVPTSARDELGAPRSQPCGSSIVTTSSPGWREHPGTA